jgi:AcrR family transcriptional regulator
VKRACIRRNLIYRQIRCKGRSVAGEAADGNERPLGPRALRTRRRLLDTTSELLTERGLRELSVVEIARRAETSPATFYQYFGGVEEATLELADEATADMMRLVETMPATLAGSAALGPARLFVRAFLDLWDAHHAVLRVRNHAAEEGDPRFRRVRRKALRPLLDRLAQVFRTRGGAAASEGVHPYAAAAALTTVLESMSAHHRELEYFGIDRDDLVETSARILVDTATGFGGR